MYIVPRETLYIAALFHNHFVAIIHIQQRVALPPGLPPGKVNRLAQHGLPMKGAAQQMLLLNASRDR